MRQAKRLKPKCNWMCMRSDEYIKFMRSVRMVQLVGNTNNVKKTRCFRRFIFKYFKT
jgi:hypothetical protein